MCHRCGQFQQIQEFQKSLASFKTAMNRKIKINRRRRRKNRKQYHIIWQNMKQDLAQPKTDEKSKATFLYFLFYFYFLRFLPPRLLDFIIYICLRSCLNGYTSLCLNVVVSLMGLMVSDVTVITHNWIRGHPCSTGSSSMTF